MPTGMPLHRVVNVRANIGRAQNYRAHLEQRPRRAAGFTPTSNTKPAIIC